MPVFDFSNTPDDNNEDFVCTYTTFRSNERTATAEKPILVLDNSKRKWKHHSCGVFANLSKQTAVGKKTNPGIGSNQHVNPGRNSNAKHQNVLPLFGTAGNKVCQRITKQ